MTRRLVTVRLANLPSPKARGGKKDLDELCDSLKRTGLIHPVVLNSRNEVVAGRRRLAAARAMGWTHIEAIIAPTFDDQLLALRAERDENTCRLKYKPVELVEIGRRLEEAERPAAAERQKDLGRTHGTPSGKLPEGSTGDTRDKVAESLGVSGKTYEKAKQVVEAAEADPDKFGDLPARMDETSVHAAHEELKARKGEATEPAPVDAWGIPVQPHAAEAFEAVPKFKELLGLLKKVQGELTALAESPGGRHLLRRCQWVRSDSKAGGRWVMAELDNAIRLLENATPRHTDCPYHFNEHQPHGGDGRPCPLCDNRRFTGTLKQFQVPPDLAARMKAHYGVPEGK
jgi:ParB-like chromosome segregation protein Spo0J